MRTIENLRRRTGVALTVLSLVGGGLFVGPDAASAQGTTCIQDVWKAHGNNQNLQCTAGDVTLSSATNIQIVTGGSCDAVTGHCSCFAGLPVTFTADFRMDLTADTRYDVGFYLATDGDPNHDGAITGSCSATASTAANTTRTNNFINLDAAPDACGDITGPSATAHNPLFVRSTVSTTCPSTPGQQLQLPFATTWRQPGSNNVCAGTGNGSTTNDVFPGSPSKCNTGLLVLDITSVSTTLTVAKTAQTASVPETGGSATYGVTVNNTSSIAVTLQSLTDNQYGDVTSVHGNVTATSCVVGDPVGTCEIGGSIAAGGSCSCTFTANVPAGDVPGGFTDIVTACADNATNPTDVCATDDATVPYTDVSSAPTLAKTASASDCRIDTTYDVVVTNTNTLETLTLNTLADNIFGSITTSHLANASCTGSTTPGVCGEVVSTTCGQAPGPGGLPALIAASGNYTCSFVGRSTVCSGTVTDTVTGGTTDEDGVTATSSDTATVVISVTRPPL
jgi:hypothetical protein